MKRLGIISTMTLLGFLVIGASQRSTDTPSKVAKKVCRGFTVIEASAGIDCNGDTIKLMKIGGYYERVP